MTSSRPRAVVLAIAASLLAGCATAPSDGSPCSHARAADQLALLPERSAIEPMLVDDPVMREQARACGRFDG